MRYYFRRGEGARVALPGSPESSEFIAAYQAALNRTELPQVNKKLRSENGTFDRLISNYLQSPDFLRMKDATQHTYLLKIERWAQVEKIEHRPVAGMTQNHVKTMMAKRSETPGAANDMLKKIRLLMNFAIEAGMRSGNPCLSNKKVPI